MSDGQKDFDVIEKMDVNFPISIGSDKFVEAKPSNPKIDIHQQARDVEDDD